MGDRKVSFFWKADCRVYGAATKGARVCELTHWEQLGNDKAFPSNRRFQDESLRRLPGRCGSQSRAPNPRGWRRFGQILID
jgi:hypothetical protein